MDVRGRQLFKHVHESLLRSVCVRARACMCVCVHAQVCAVVFLALIDVRESAAEFHNQPRVTTLSEM